MASLETPRFPDMLARNLVCGPSFATRVIFRAGAKEQRNQTWSRERWVADAASAPHTMEDLAQLEAFFRAVAGQLHSFRLRDHADYIATTDNGRLAPMLGDVQTGAIGGGYGVAAYQLTKLYAAGALAYHRWISKPVAGSVSLTRGGNPVTLGSGAGNAGIDATSGRVTFVADQQRSITTHVTGTQHQITFASAFAPNFSVGGRLWITGVTGSAAATLNDRSHEITVVGGATISIATNTTGSSASGGSGAFFPQPAEALRWSGRFDVHMRFGTDRFDRQMLARQLSGDFIAQAITLPLIEVI